MDRLAAADTMAQTLPARLIVCERTGCWAVALRRELADAGVRVWETRTLADCFDELAESPASFAVLELRGDVAGLLCCLARQIREFPRARVAVVADGHLADYEWLMREAGAVRFLCSPRRVGRLAQLALRHLAQVPPPPQNLTERIWASLPWGPGRAAGTREG
jgi:ActR/RegA family two-component response regulator